MYDYEIYRKYKTVGCKSLVHALSCGGMGSGRVKRVAQKRLLNYKRLFLRGSDVHCRFCLRP